ncbi:MAG: hypothetical protein WHU94_13550 [Thermogemmata sp.]
MARFLVVTDTPGIKQFVFGTDALAEVRGASALLDRLNREDTADCLGQSPQVHITTVFANGGTGQFIVEAPDRRQVEEALDRLAAYYRQETGGEMWPLAGVAEWPETADYRTAVRMAYEHLHLLRNWGSCRLSIPTFPLVLECQSTSHLPAVGVYRWSGEQLLLSQASQCKRNESRRARRGILWSGWMAFLDESLGSQGQFYESADDLRPSTTVDIGDYAQRRGYIGLIYADGNAMGRLVQELNSPEVCQAFSELVDSSVRDACYEALSVVCELEIREVRNALQTGDHPRPLPADILLLGGDDLLVLLPAERALDFALNATAAFERLTRERQAQLPEAARRFFAERGLADRGLTISCGVALGPANYPFYLLRDLAEELLQSAKRGGSVDPQRTDYWAPSYIDFHQLAGSVSQDLSLIRQEDYRTDSDHPRTLRPYRRDHLEQLRQAALRLQQAKIPRSKLHDLFEAALEPRWFLAQTRCRELFGRLREDNSHHERRGLWEALRTVRQPIDLFSYPWLKNGQRSPTALADLVEAHDLFSDTNRSNWCAGEDA